MSIITKALKKVQRLRQEEQRKSEDRDILEITGILQSDETNKINKAAVDQDARVLPEKEVSKLRVNTSAIRKLSFISLFVVMLLGGIACILLYINRPLLVMPPAISSPESTTTSLTEQEISTTKVGKKIPSASSIPAKLKNLPTLNGIMYSVSYPQAIVNGRVVSEGETVGKFSIIKIFPNKIKITSGNTEFELELR